MLDKKENKDSSTNYYPEVKLNRNDYSEDFLKFIPKEESVKIDEVPVVETVTAQEPTVAEPVCDEVYEKEPEKPLTERQYTEAINMCRNVFIEKLSIYGPSWRVLHKESITDQIYIRINKIINMVDNHNNVNDLISELRSIVNYGIIYLIQSQLGYSSNKDIPSENAIRYFDGNAQRAYDVMQYKNDIYYKESWRLMRIFSFLDFILMKTLRIKEVEVLGDNSKYDIHNNYLDIINYALFALIQLAL